MDKGQRAWSGSEEERERDCGHSFDAAFHLVRKKNYVFMSNMSTR